MLSLIASPIGNLKDFSLRAIEVLKSADLVLCEDTRRSSILLNHYEIKVKLFPHHKFNEKETLFKIIEFLQEGKKIALLSDAGTPCINDPGSLLVQKCIQEKIPFTLIPGPCSLISALVLSGFDLERFQSVGFLPKKGALDVLRKLLYYPGVSVALESPERIAKTLSIIESIDPQRNVAVAREISKTFEECLRGNVTDVLKIIESRNVLGEICLVIAPNDAFNETVFEPEDLIEELQKNLGVDLKKAILMASQLLKKPKREIYKKIHSSD